MAIVRDAQVALPGVAPVAEQHRQRAVAGRERDRCGVARRRRRLGPHEPALVASVLSGHEVPAEGQRRQGVRALPRGAERGRPAGRHVEPQLLVGRCEAAATEAAEHDVTAAAEDDEVDLAVAVDVDRVGAGHGGQVGDGRRERGEAQGPADRAVVVVERRRLGAAGEEELVTTVAVAVERGHAAAHEVLELAVVAVVDAGGRRVVDEVGGGAAGGAAATARRQQGDGRADGGHEQHPGRSPPAPGARRPARRWPADGARPD